MNTKILTTIVLTFLVLAAFSAVTSVFANSDALVLTTEDDSVEVAHGTSAIMTFTLNNTDAENSIEEIVLTAEGPEGITLQASPDTIAELAAGSLTQVTLTLTVPQYTSQISFGTVTLSASGRLGTSDVSAEGTFTVTIPQDNSLEITDVGLLTKAIEETTFKLKNTGNTGLSGTLSVGKITDSDGNEIELELSKTTFSLTEGQEETLAVSYSELPAGLNLGRFSADITADVQGVVSKTAEISFENSFCEYGEIGQSIEIISLKDKSSENDWDWKPLDEVELEIKVKNNLEDDEYFTVEYGLYDSAEGDFVDFENDGDNEFTIAINEDDDEKETFTVIVPPDIEDKYYRLYVKVYLEDEEDELCTDKIGDSYYQTIKVDKESRDTIVNFVDMPSSAMCGETIEISTKVFNVGKKDEDKVYLNLESKELGIDEDSHTFDLDEGDSERVSFSITVPKDTGEKLYPFKFTTYYYYDKTKDRYRERSEDYIVYLKVEGNCQSVIEKNVEISAVLKTEAPKAGEEISVGATLKNTGEEETTYSIFLTGYETWAESAIAQPPSITIQPGQSKDVAITIKPNRDAVGENMFTIQTVYDTQTKEQIVAVNIEGKRGITGSAVREAFGENWFIWVIVAINIILIILIIVVAIKMSRTTR